MAVAGQSHTMLPVVIRSPLALLQDCLTKQKLMCQQYMTIWDSAQLVRSIPWKVFVETAVILSAAGMEHYDTGIKCPV